MKDPDIELISASKKGHKASFGKLVKAYYEMVYAVSYGVLRNREAARDSTQEAFLKAFKQIRKFQGKSKFKTWLYRIAMNTAIDQTRKRKPSISLDATDSSSEGGQKPVIIPEPGRGPRGHAGASEEQAMVRDALQELSPEHRAVLVLREWEDLSYEEIAETLGIEMGTVMSRIFYARKKLGEILKPRLEGTYD